MKLLSLVRPVNISPVFFDYLCWLFLEEMKKYIPQNKLKHLIHKIEALPGLVRERLSPPGETDYRQIPVIINNFNRLDSLTKLINSLEKRGYFNIFIIDNLSTYPPLLDYYRDCRHPVFRLDKNLGSSALWKSGLYRRFRSNYFVYTDSDVVPVEECPDDFMLFFLETLREHRFAQKVGFMMKLDDLPACNLMRDYILECEGHFYTDYKLTDLLYRAPIATTFALYRPWAKRKHANGLVEMYRTGFPYLARHLPWYQDTLNPDDEEKYYLEHLGHSTWWTTKARKMLGAKD